MTFRELDMELDGAFVIDLLSEQDRRGFKLSCTQMTSLANSGVEQWLAKCSTREEVFVALEEALKLAQSKSFILQFTAHGSSDGITNNGSIPLITWADFCPPLTELNRAFGGNLIVTMLSCKGFGGLDIDTKQSSIPPYYALVGPVEDLPVIEAHVVLDKFYSRMLEGIPIPTIVIGINQEAGRTVLMADSSQSNRGS